MDAVAACILRFQTQLKQSMKHNHPPMTGIVPGCDYCTRFGNLFENGTVPLNQNPCLHPKMFCLHYS